MSVQEAAERLERDLEREEEEDEKDEKGREEASSVNKRNSPIAQLLILMDLYASGMYTSIHAFCVYSNIRLCKRFLG